MQHIDNFRRHEKLQQVREEAAQGVCDSIYEMVLAGKVPRDLEAIFRKGSDWDLGVDHILILQVRGLQAVIALPRANRTVMHCLQTWDSYKQTASGLCKSHQHGLAPCFAYLALAGTGSIFTLACRSFLESSCCCFYIACCLSRHRRTLLTRRCKNSFRSLQS